MGGAKTALIGRFPLLKWYQDEFRKALMQPGARLMVMGYSFSDDHINDAIFTAAKNSALLSPSEFTGARGFSKNASIEP